MNLVLIAEDEEALLEVFASVVEDLGHKVLVAHDGAEALTLARAHRPNLVITDHMMPRLTGVALLRAIRSEPEIAEVPVILASAARPNGAEEATLFLPKPIGLRKFELAVEACLKGAPTLKEAATPRGLSPDQRSALSVAKSELFSWVAHEIKTPLSSARLNTQLMLRHPSVGEDAGQRRKAEAVIRQLDRMDQLVTSVLDAAKLADGRIALHLERTALQPFLTELLATWRDLQPDVVFELAMPPEPLELNLDAERVRQVLDNLLSNAVKYGRPANRVEVRAEDSPGRVLIHVRDHGQGISASELPRIFDRFHRAEGATGEGHGLGLYIAAALAKLHGGSLHARSQRGEGATFTLTLPSTR